MDEQNTITTEMMDEIMNEHFPAVTTVDYHGHELTVRKAMTFKEMALAVNKIVDACFDEDTGDYLPEVEEFVTRVVYTEICTNVQLPNDVESQYRILFTTDLWDTVREALLSEQYYGLCEAVERRIDERNATNRKLFENEIQKAIEAIGELGEQMTKLFDGVSADDLQGLLNAIGDGGVDEAKLVKEVVKQQNIARKDDGDTAPALEVIEGGAEE